jgi:hypothetical protein
MTTPKMEYTEDPEEMVAILKKMIAEVQAGRLNPAEIKVFYKDGTASTIKIGSDNPLPDAAN